MLSTSAFNALLKTLEEPPKHVIFILATTEINKVPETIISRCQCYDFKRISVDDIVDCLSNICTKENIDADEDVLKLIASYCNGGMRDSIGLLDKLLSYSNVINKQLFYDVVGLVDNNIISELFVDICNCNTKSVFDSVERLVNHGKSIELITEQLLSYLRSLSVDNSISMSSDDFIKIVNGVSNIFNGLRNSFNQMLFFVFFLFKIIKSLSDDSKVKNDTKIISREIILENNEELRNVNKSEEKVLKNEQTFKNRRKDFDIIINNAFALANKDLKNEIVNKWKGFYDYVHNKEFSSLFLYYTLFLHFQQFL